MTDATAARVMLWGTQVGAVLWDPQRESALFEYDDRFLAAPVELAPLMMPKRKGVYSFSGLPKETFKGLPGMLADALPDKFGNLLIDQWLTATGRDRASFDPVQRLCYIGSRGMGALEFEPVLSNPQVASEKLLFDELVSLAEQALHSKGALATRLEAGQEDKAVQQIISVGTSAGGARAKAVIAYNAATQEIRSGQLQAPAGFSHYLLKLDVSGNSDKEGEDPPAYGRIEYAYYLMARAAGIDMSECRLLEHNGRAHFMTQRFDRLENGSKLHMQSLCAIGHYDFNAAGGYAYEQAMDVIRRVITDPGLQRTALVQQFRRAVFNVVARNQDDHTKNIAFLMDRRGVWRLSPAFDVTYSYNPEGAWTSRHQMTINQQRDGFTLDDLLALGAKANLKKATARAEIDQIVTVVRQQWPSCAAAAGVREQAARAIAAQHRLHFD
ncbi:toxin HipA [Pokkaliibacter plantistimulans]|uniref:Toxin HipA n=1 Tax=Pokkaliibacter plantistimulans TaxID=1635171 RepID=A0ABX5LVB2_9GAMM|nr:type II toxin-antitoxin system HipA family toxin [Pokkaliibacter plantistimulans]PXF30089.1 toxin HipA [Pokkaliibacter plantistimulans]